MFIHACPRFATRYLPPRCRSSVDKEILVDALPFKKENFSCASFITSCIRLLSFNTTMLIARPAQISSKTQEPTPANSSSVHIIDGTTVYEWSDKETYAYGWIVIDSPQPTLAGGGLFMHPDATLQEVQQVARTMTHKLAVSPQPQLVGAKGGIRFNHNDPRAHKVVERFVRDNANVISRYWATGGDLNTSHHEINRYLQKYCGLPSALAPFARDLNSPSSASEIERFLSSPMDLRGWNSRLDEASVGFGMAVTLLELLKRYSPALVGQCKISIQGFGTVGTTFGHFAKRLGLGKIVAISACDGFYVDDDIDVDAICAQKPLNAKRLADILPSSMLYSANFHARKQETDGDFLARFFKAQKCNVFAPCAGRYVLDERAIRELSQSRSGEVQFLVAGANNIFAQHVCDDSGAPRKLLSTHSVIMVPEFVSNSGTSNLFVRSCSTNISKWTPDMMLNAVRQDIVRFLETSLTDSPNDTITACISHAFYRKQNAKTSNRLGVKAIAGLVALSMDPAKAAETYSLAGAATAGAIAGGRQPIEFKPSPSASNTSSGLEIIFGVLSLDQVKMVLDAEQIPYKSTTLPQHGQAFHIGYETAGYDMYFCTFKSTVAKTIAKQRYSVRSWDHYTMIVEDAYAVADFHQKFLGFTFLREIELNAGSAAEGETDMLNVVLGFPGDDRRSIVITQGLKKESVFARLHNQKTRDYVHHIAFEVDNVEAAFQDVRDAGLSTTSDKISKDMLSGLKQFFIREEHAGHFVEMIEREATTANAQGDFRVNNMASLAQSMESYVK